MAKVSSIEKNEHRRRLIEKYRSKRDEMKKKFSSKELSIEERFALAIKMSELKRNSSAVRYRNRCAVTGRPRAYLRKFGMSRIALRELSLCGQIPGVVKDSW